MAQKGFDIVYDEQVYEHIRAIEKRYHGLIKKIIQQQLTYEPHIETRNRKPLEPPTPWSEPWEIRFGPDNRFRVFYKFDLDEKKVLILAVGVKQRNRLIIGKEEIDL